MIAQSPTNRRPITKLRSLKPDVLGTAAQATLEPAEQAPMHLTNQGVWAIVGQGDDVDYCRMICDAN